MNGYIAISKLAKDLKTSNQKVGQIINSLDIERSNMRDGKWYSKCIPIVDVDKIKAVVKDFRVDQTGDKTKPAPERKIEHFVGDNSDKLFREPIVVVDIKRGRIGGTGMEAVWAKERYEIIMEG